jgi:hypothetical protein
MHPGTIVWVAVLTVVYWYVRVGSLPFLWVVLQLMLWKSDTEQRKGREGRVQTKIQPQ